MAEDNLGVKMREANGPSVNVKELMEVIRAEARRRRALSDSEPKPGSFESGSSAPSSGLMPEQTHTQLQGGSALFARKEGGYHKDDFLRFHGEDFLNQAYHAILMREPDPAGYHHYLQSLREGKLTRIDILGRLRYCQEGRAKAVKIRGLKGLFLVHSSFRIPLLGYFCRLLTGIANLPTFISNFQKLEAHAQLQLFSLQDALGQTSTAINNLQEYQDRTAEDTIARIETVEKLMVQKSDRSELENLATLKADREELIAVHDKLKQARQQLRDHKLNILDQQRRIMMLLEETRKHLPAELQTGSIENILNEEAHLLDAMYVAFEDRFRGAREEIKERLQVYLPYIEEVQAQTDNAPLLDVGCGRGEWLELMREKGYAALGIDHNKIMIRSCLELDLDVIETDLIKFLRNQKANYFAAVTGFHLIEHLQLDVLVKFFDESLRVLKPGGMIIYETPNPENLIMAAFSFYSDLTHIKPMVPQTVQFLAEQRGFVRTEIKRLHKYSDNLDLEENDTFKKNWFYSEMDFAIIAYKA